MGLRSDKNIDVFMSSEINSAWKVVRDIRLIETHDDIIKWKHFPRYLPFVREFTDHMWIPLTKPVTRIFDVFCCLRSYKKLSKQSRHRWFETPSRSIMTSLLWVTFNIPLSFPHTRRDLKYLLSISRRVPIRLLSSPSAMTIDSRFSGYCPGIARAFSDCFIFASSL